MNLKCPNCSNTKDLAKPLDELYKCELCSTICCWSCEDVHARNHCLFADIAESQLEEFAIKEEVLS